MATVADLNGDHLRFYCPGCECSHRIAVRPGHQYVWQWNESITQPTLSPSIHFKDDEGRTTCHSYVSNGRIMFLADSRHKLAGHTVDLPEIQ